MPGTPDAGPIIIPIELLQLGDCVGEGSTGSVKYAKHAQWGEVAIKLLHTSKPGLPKKDRRKLEAEGEKLRALSHKQIVQLYGVVCEPNYCGLVMQFMPKGSLTHFVKNYDVPNVLKVKFAYEIILGMNYLHTLDPPVIHRDLKSLNILIADDLSAKISDFGLAVWRGITRTHSFSKVQTDSDKPMKWCAGTPAYIPPESWADVGREPDQSFDIYAYGILLYEMMSEKEPYQNVTSLEHLILAVKEGQRPNLGDVPDEVAELKEMMQACWQNVPQHRPNFSKMKSSLEPVYECNYKPRVTDAMVDILHQIQDEGEDTAPRHLLTPDRESCQMHAQPISSSGKSGMDYPPLHEFRRNDNALLQEGYSNNSTVPVQSSNGDSPPGAMAIHTERERKIPLVLAGPNVPTPSDWPSNLAGSGTDVSNMLIPPFLRNGHMVLNGGSVEVDFLNQPVNGTYKARRNAPFVGFHENGGSNVAIPNLSSHVSADGGGSTPSRLTPESNPGLLEAGGNPTRAADNSIPGIDDRIRQESPNTPVVRFTITDPKAVDYGANSKLLPDNFQQMKIDSTYTSSTTGDQVKPELLSNPTQETSNPSTSQATGAAGSSFNQFYEQFLKDQRQHADKTNGVQLHPSPGKGFTMTKHDQGNMNASAVYHISNMASLQIGDYNVTNVHDLPQKTGGVGPAHNPNKTGQPAKKKLKVPARMINSKDIKVVADDLGSSWKALARQLQFTTGQIDTIEHDYHLDGLHEKIHQLLEQWRLRRKAEASVKNLLVNLIEIGRPDIATKMASDVQVMPAT